MNIKPIAMILTIATAAIVNASVMAKDEGEIHSFFEKKDDNIIITSLSSCLNRNSLTIADDNEDMDDRSILEKFRKATENFEEEIDLSEFHIKCTDEDVQDIYEMLTLLSPRSYYLVTTQGKYGYNYNMNSSGDELTFIYPSYVRYASEYGADDSMNIYGADGAISQELLAKVKETDKIAEKQNKFDSVVAKMMSLTDSDAPDMEKLIAYHDYLIENYDYAWSDIIDGKNIYKHNTAMDMVMSGIGECQSFTSMMNYMAMANDMETGFVTSYRLDSEGNITDDEYHMWNLIEFAAPGQTEKKWYNIDVTWDENATERSTDGNILADEGRVSMRYFATSDEYTYKSHGYSPTGDNEKVDYEIAGWATDKSLDNMPWRFSDSNVVLVNDVYYFIDWDSETDLPTLYSYDGKNRKVLFDEMSDNWKYNDIYVEKIAFSGLVLNEGNLYFNDEKNLYEYNISSGKTEKTENADLTEYIPEGSDIYGMINDDNKLYLCVSKINDTNILEKISKTEKEINAEVSSVEIGVEGNILSVTIDSDIKKGVSLFIQTADGFQTISDDMIGAKKYDFTVDSVEVDVFVWDKNMTPLQEKKTIKLN